LTDDINIISKYFTALKKSGIDSTKSAFCYFSSSEVALGYSNFLRIKKKIGTLKLLFEHIKNISGILTQEGYMITHKNNHKKDFKSLIITWAYRNSFDHDGNLFDRYLGINSKKTKNTIWFVIYLDQKEPVKVSSNIILLKKQKTFFLNKLYYLIKVFLKVIRVSGYQLKKINHYFTTEFNFANIIVDKLSALIELKRIREIRMPYESQIFQNEIYKFAKRRNKKIKNLAFLTYTHPLSKELIFDRSNQIDKLYLYNKNQRKVFIEYLKWPSRNIKFIQKNANFRERKNIYTNKVFLPYFFKDSDSIVKSFENYLKLFNKEINIKQLIIQQHPSPYNPSKQLMLKKKLIKIIKKFSDKKKIKYKKNLSIVIGLSSLPIKLIKSKINFIHISNDEENQIFSNKYWHNLKYKQIMKNIFKYYNA